MTTIAGFASPARQNSFLRIHLCLPLQTDNIFNNILTVIFLLASASENFMAGIWWKHLVAGGIAGAVSRYRRGERRCCRLNSSSNLLLFFSFINFKLIYVPTNNFLKYQRKLNFCMSFCYMSYYYFKYVL